MGGPAFERLSSAEFRSVEAAGQAAHDERSEVISDGHPGLQAWSIADCALRMGAPPRVTVARWVCRACRANVASR
jgi:hypothetical protein